MIESVSLASQISCFHLLKLYWNYEIWKIIKKQGKGTADHLKNLYLLYTEVHVKTVSVIYSWKLPQYPGHSTPLPTNPLDLIINRCIIRQLCESSLCYLLLRKPNDWPLAKCWFQISACFLKFFLQKSIHSLLLHSCFIKQSSEFL